MPTHLPKSAPDYLVLGHVSKDLVEGGGYRAGGTVIYSALAAQRLGLQAAIVTACAPEDDWLLDPAREAGIWVHRVPSPQSTTFRNSYTAEGGRTQVIEAQAVPIKLEHVPEEWLGAHVVHLGPVAQELPVGLVAAFADSRDPGENPPLLGVTPQGWMRSWGDDGRVRHEARPIPTPLLNLPPNAFLVLSIEDLGGDNVLARHYVNLSALAAITYGAGPAYLCSGGQCRPVPAVPASVVDPTGAGDVFATALFVRYHETGDLVASARFAHAAAACNVEGQGTEGIRDRGTVESRLKPHVQ